MDGKVDVLMEEKGVVVRSDFEDYSTWFTTDTIFPSRDELISWARAVDKQKGFVVVIIRSDNGGIGQKTMLILGCERGGKYRKYKNELQRKGTGSKKCDCPFRLRARPLLNGEGWKIHVVCGLHNHDVAETLEGHPYVGRLSEEEKSLLGDMTKNMVKPKNILLTLKDHSEDNVTSMKQIYNARQAFRRAERGPRTELQHLMKLMERDNYVVWYRKVEMTEVVRDIFWTHPDSVKLLNAFHIVLIIDTTYKTNKYRLPLLEIVGVTSIELTFSVAFAYIESERVENFKWVMEKLRGLIPNEEALPKVIVTDRDLALMNAVATIFPNSTHLLCQFHISKNVKAKCKMLISPSEHWESVMNSWMSVMDSSTEDEFEERVEKLEDICSPFSIFIDYIKKTWLLPFKERFVTYWIDKVMHLGNTTTNRVEGAHARLKKMLKDSRGDLCLCWDAMNNMIILQHSEIKGSFEKSLIVVEHRFNKGLYSKLRGFVSKNALCHIILENERIKIVGIDSSLCGCSLRTTHGLPCACELARYNMMSVSVPLDSIHGHWKKLTFADQGIAEAGYELSLKADFETIQKRFDELDLYGKIVLKTKVHELAYPDTISMYPPPDKVRTKGSVKRKSLKIDCSTKRDPSYFEHVDAFHLQHDSTSSPVSSVSKPIVHNIKRKIPLLHEFPTQLHEYIEHIVDVRSDGNCGYRAVAALIGMGEDSWAQMRLDLLRELTSHESLYVDLYGNMDRFRQIRESLLIDSYDKPVTIDKWMTIPDMGYVISTRYRVVFVVISKQGSMTFFPLRGEPPASSLNHRIICVGLVNKCHFVQVFLRNGCPLPPTALQWHRYCDADAQKWESPYYKRMSTFGSLFSSICFDHVDLIEH